MTRSEIKSLATLLTVVATDSDTQSRFVDDVFNELAFNSTCPFVKVLIKPITLGTATYSFESDMLQILAAFLHDKLLSSTNSSELNAYNTNWSSQIGTPVAITQDELTARNYTIFPIPNISTDAVIPIHGEPFGEDYAANSLVLFYTDNRESEIVDILTLPIAFFALSREFIFPSDHTDIEYASICSKLATFLFSLIGIK